MRGKCTHGDTSRYANGRCRACKKVERQRRKTQRRDYASRWHETLRGTASRMLAKVRRRAIQYERGPTTITAEWIAERLARGVCEVSGVAFVLRKGYRGPYVPSVDRRDCSKGYTPENCRLILWALNAAFLDWGADVFAEVAEQWLAFRKSGRDLV